MFSNFVEISAKKRANSHVFGFRGVQLTSRAHVRPTSAQARFGVSFISVRCDWQPCYLTRARALDDASAGPMAELALNAEVPASHKQGVREEDQVTDMRGIFAQRPRTRRS
jgi:hypothetical protein